MQVLLERAEGSAGAGRRWELREDRARLRREVALLPAGLGREASGSSGAASPAAIAAYATPRAWDAMCATAAA